jgi:hypothetical protein
MSDCFTKCSEIAVSSATFQNISGNFPDHQRIGSRLCHYGAGNKKQKCKQGDFDKPHFFFFRGIKIRLGGVPMYNLTVLLKETGAYGTPHVNKIRLLSVQIPIFKTKV